MSLCSKSTIPWLLLILPALVCAGCTNLAEKAPIDQDFKVIEGEAALFKKCLEIRGGDCPEGDPATPLPHSSQHRDTQPVTPADPGRSEALAESVAKLPAGHPAKIAHEVLSHPVVRQATVLHDHLRGHDVKSTSDVTVEKGRGPHGGPQSTVTMDMKLGQVRHLHDRLLTSLGTRAWEILDGHCQDLLKERQDAADKLETDCRRVAFVRGYLGAYLRHGEIIEVDVGLAGAIRAAKQGEVEGIDQQLVRDIDDELNKVNKALSNVFKVSEVGFVSRDATFQARLPTVAVTLDPTVKHLLTVTDRDTGQLLTARSDFAHLGAASDTSGVATGAAIGAELVRVFLEALFDAHEGLPAVAPANLHGVKPTGLTLGSYSLPVFQAPAGNVDAHDLTVMTHLNEGVALKTRLLVSRIISGVGPFSLNNPPLESFITEIVATSVRKAVEKASWCWYACNLDVEAERLGSDIGKAVEDKLSTEEETLQTDLKTAVEKARAWTYREAEHVKLRLRIDRNE